MHRSSSARLRSAIARRLPRARGLDVASDFDGTLVPIVSHPRRTVLAARMRRAVIRLGREPGVRVAVLSGRRLADLERHAALPGVHLVGLAGIESRDRHGRRHVHGRGRLAPELIESLRAWCARHHGTWIEDKGPARSVHYRGLESASRPAFLRGLARRLAPHRAAVEVTRGLLVHELRPAGSPDKADALERWRGRSSRDRLLIYLGDDANDRPALSWVRRQGGLAISVGPRPLAAPYHLAGPHVAMALLEWLVRAWHTRRAHAASRWPTPARARRSARA